MVWPVCLPTTHYPLPTPADLFKKVLSLYCLLCVTKNTFKLAVQSTFWLACAAVATLSLMPVGELPDIALDLWDKAQHAAGFFALGCIGLVAYSGHKARVFLGLLAFGVAIELAQSAIGWRTGDVLDWVADALGITAAASGFWWRSRTLR